MKAIILKNTSGYNISIEDVNEPEVGNEDVKIRVEAAGICGTDVHISKGGFGVLPPVILGHEFSGTIVDIDDHVSNYKIGERVVSESVIYSCNECDCCISGHYSLCKNRRVLGIQVNGAFTEYVVVPKESVFKLPDNIDFISGALTEPLASCVHGIIEEAHISVGDRVLISGPGSIGLLSLQVARLAGGEILISGTDEDGKRLNLASELGADHTFIITDKNFDKEIMDLTNNCGVDVAIECAGTDDSLKNCINLLKRKGKLIQIGIFSSEVLFNFNQAICKEIKLIPTISHTRRSWELSLRLMSRGLVKTSPLVTHTFSLIDWQEAFRVSQSHECIKVIVLPKS